MKPKKHHLKAASEKWQLDTEASLLQYSESFVYESSIAGKPVILRVTEPKHRAAEELLSELDWMSFLSHSGVQLATPISSIMNSFVETLEFEEIYHVTVFEKVPGQSMKEPNDFTLENFNTWGRYLGKLHKLTKEYQPGVGIKPRARWNEDAGFQVTKSGLDVKDKVPYKRFHELYDWIQSLEPTVNNFGLIHADLHYHNFFMDEGEMNAFDFDDSCYNWFSYDLAVPMHSVLRLVENNKINFSYEEIFKHYIKGYLSENNLEQKWIDRIDLFLKFRTCTLYHWAKARNATGTIGLREQSWYKELCLWSNKHLEAELKFNV